MGKKKTHRIRSNIGSLNKIGKIKADLFFNGIEYCSMLEVNMAHKLYEVNLLRLFEYENKTFVISRYSSLDLIEYKTINKKLRKIKKPFSPAIKITPDFVSEELGIIIEVKGGRNIDSKFTQKWNLFKKFLSDSNLNYTIALLETTEAMDEFIEIIMKKEKYGKTG